MKQHSFVFSDQEIGTILAALRHYQHSRRGRGHDLPMAINDIATDFGRLSPLRNEEIDRLCERLNVGPTDGNAVK
jgi:hypothetical protein